MTAFDIPDNISKAKNAENSRKAILTKILVEKEIGHGTY